MTAHLHIGGQTESIPLQENTFMIGVFYSYKSGNNLSVLDGFGEFFPSHSAYLVERFTPEGVKITLTCYTSDDPQIREILERYQGINMVEITDRYFALTVTV